VPPAAISSLAAGRTPSLPKLESIPMPSLALTPRGHLLFNGADDASQPPIALWRTLEGAFARGSDHGLLELGGSSATITERPDGSAEFSDSTPSPTDPASVFGGSRIYVGPLRM
jgi:hypothetical protein